MILKFLLQEKGQGESTDSRDDKQHKNIHEIYTASVNHVFDRSHVVCSLLISLSTSENCRS